MHPIQTNFDGQGVNLKLKDIFALDGRCKALFGQCVITGLMQPLKDNESEFLRKFKPRIQTLVGFSADKRILSAPETYETFYKACLEAVNCWDYYRPIRDRQWAYGAFKKKFGTPPRFNQKALGGLP